jgi:hypothetical protein
MAKSDGSAKKKKSKENIPEAADYRLMIQSEWADIHHSRGQEWTALGVVTGAHLGILQLLIFVRDLNVPIPFQFLAMIGSAMALVFSVLGILMTCRHRRLMYIKIDWIARAEDALGLLQTKRNPAGIIPPPPSMEKPSPAWRGLMLPRFLSTSWLILCIYLMLGLLDVLSIVLFAVL